MPCTTTGLSPYRQAGGTCSPRIARNGFETGDNMTQRQRYLPPVLQNLPFPVIGSPLFIISNPKLVIAQCKAGVVGSMPALNARPAS